MIRLFALIALAMLLLSCAGSETATQSEAAPIQTYDLHGVVVRLVPENQVAVIKHDDIGDWMKAMTMDFPVKDKAEYDKLAPGDEINCKVHVQDLDFWLDDIQVVSKSKAEAGE